MMYEREVGFLDAIKLAFTKYFQFSGRAQRAEYWWFILFSFMGVIVLALFDSALLGLASDEEGLFSTLFAMAVLIPGLSVGWRRLHDTGRSGWWLLFPYATLIWVVVAVITMGLKANGTAAGSVAISGFVAFFGSIAWIMVMLAKDSNPHPNRFGHSPKYGDEDDGMYTELD